MMRWHDVTRPLEPGMAVWPGDPAFVFEPLNRISNGAGCNTSLIRCATHTGTHVDAPWHFEEDGPRLDELDASLFFGPATILALPGVTTIRAADLGPQPLPCRLLLKTDNSLFPVDGPFRPGFVALEADAAQRLVNERVRLIAIDYLSIAPYHRGDETHHCLLRNEIVVVEGLNLQGISSGACEFVVLPMSIAGADGAPCRAFVGIEE